MKQTEKPSPGAGFSDEERAAMRARAKELKAEARLGASRADGERAVLEVIAALPDASREMSERLHALIKASAPALSPKTWYGMPAYSNDDGKVICFFRPAEKFKERYMTLGFNELANLDKGNLWPIAFALTQLTTVEEEEIRALIRKAVG